MSVELTFKKTILTFKVTVPYTAKYDLSPERIAAFERKISEFVDKDLIPFTNVLRFHGEPE